MQTLAQKLLLIQKTIRAVSKSSDNPHFRSKYADLNEVLDAAKEGLNKEGVFIAQSPGADAFGKFLETSLIDAESGNQISGRVYFSGVEDNMQKIGAAITYARRFGLVSLLALESEDDDGETAVGRGRKVTEAIRPSEAKPEKVPAPKAQSPVVPKIPSPCNRKTLNDKIGQTAKVLVDSKRMTAEEAVALITAFGVKTKEELTDADAGTVLSQFEARLKT